MPRPKVKIDPNLQEQARKELNRLPYPRKFIQLMAIMSARDYPVDTVAGILQVSRRSIFRWIDRLKKHGSEGLEDKPKGHMKAKLSPQHIQTIKKWLQTSQNTTGESTHWTLKKLQAEVYEVFHIKISTTALWKYLKEQGIDFTRQKR